MWELEDNAENMRISVSTCFYRYLIIVCYDKQCGNIHMEYIFNNFSYYLGISLKLQHTVAVFVVGYCVVLKKIRINAT